MVSVDKSLPEKGTRIRLDQAVRSLFALTWNQSRSDVRKGKIAVNGEILCDGATYVGPGDRLTRTEDAPRPAALFDIRPEQILFMDRYLIVVVKPSGILTVPYEDDTFSFDRQVRVYLSRKDRPLPTRRRSAMPPLMVVHRLDKGTSGVLVFARTFAAKEGLAVQFRDHSIHRKYLAVVHGTIDSRTVRSHLLTDRGDGLRGSREHATPQRRRRAGSGKEAVTHILLEQAFEGATLISCQLETGRTNQIRIHLSEQGNPIVGDTVYLRDYRGTIIPAPRLMLHAAELGFIHPVTGQSMRFEAPLPDAFRNHLNVLKKRKKNAVQKIGRT